MKTDALKRLNACSDAVEWAATQKNATEAWANCERGDWMLWLLAKTQCRKPGVRSRGPLVKAACACARLSLKYVPKGEKRPLAAIRAAEKWADGELAIEVVMDAADAADAAYAAADAANAAYAAAYAANAADAADAAYAAADAANAAYAAAYAANAAYAAANAAADAANAANAAYAAADAANAAVLKKCAVIVRKYFPKPPSLGSIR